MVVPGNISTSRLRTYGVSEEFVQIAGVHTPGVLTVGAPVFAAGVRTLGLHTQGIRTHMVYVFGY